MGRFANRYRLDLIMLLLERDGNLCRACPVPHAFRSINEMRIDHIDGSKSHHCFRNLRLSCHERNIRNGLALALDIELDPARDPTWIQSQLDIRQLPIMATGATCRQTYACVRAPADGQAGAATQSQDPASVAASRQAQAEAADEPTLTATMRKNKECEAPFNDWLDAQLQAGLWYTFEEYADAGANEFRCSPDTIKKYLKKRLNPINGDLRLGLRTDDASDKQQYVMFNKQRLDDLEGQ